MVLCPNCSKERDNDGLPMIPSALVQLFEIAKFSMMMHCDSCGQFFMKRHPKYREQFCQEMPGGQGMELPKGCLHIGAPFKHNNRGIR